MKWAPNKKLHFEIAIIKAMQTLEQATLSEILDALAAIRSGGEMPARRRGDSRGRGEGRCVARAAAAEDGGGGRGVSVVQAAEAGSSSSVKFKFKSCRPRRWRLPEATPVVSETPETPPAPRTPLARRLRWMSTSSGWMSSRPCGGIVR